MCRVIDLVKTGKNIERLLSERGLTARDVQQRLGFAERRPVYFWIQGKNLLRLKSGVKPRNVVQFYDGVLFFVSTCLIAVQFCQKAWCLFLLLCSAYIHYGWRSEPAIVRLISVVPIQAMHAARTSMMFRPKHSRATPPSELPSAIPSVNMEEASVCPLAMSAA